MPEIIALSCPVCDAPLAPEAEKCGYCGSYIVIKTDLPKLERHTLNQALIQEHIADFRKRIRSDQYDEEAHYGLGLAYYSLGLIHDAIEELTQAAKLMPENPHIQSQLSVALFDSWKAGDANAEPKLNQRINSTLLLEPDNLEASILRIEVLIQKKQHREAVVALDDLIRRDISAAKEKLISYLQDLGNQYLDSGNWDDAAWCWRTLRSVDTDASSDLALRFMALNPNLAPKQFRKLRTDRNSSGPSKTEGQAQASNKGLAKRIVLLVLTILAAGFAGLMIMAIIVAAGADPDAAPNGTRTAVGLLAFLVVLVAGPVWYWKRSGSPSTLNQIAHTTSGSFPKPIPSTSKFTDFSRIFAAADKTLEKIEIHRKFLEAQQQARKK